VFLTLGVQPKFSWSFAGQGRMERKEPADWFFFHCRGGNRWKRTGRRGGGGEQTRSCYDLMCIRRGGEPFLGGETKSGDISKVGGKEKTKETCPHDREEKTNVDL